MISSRDDLQDDLLVQALQRCSEGLHRVGWDDRVLERVEEEQRNLNPLGMSERIVGGEEFVNLGDKPSELAFAHFVEVEAKCCSLSQ